MIKVNIQFLKVVYDGGELSTKEIARKMDSSGVRTYNTLNYLKKRGLVKRRIIKEDNSNRIKAKWIIIPSESSRAEKLITKEYGEQSELDNEKTSF